MFAPYNVFFILLSYLLLLFGVAWVARGGKAPPAR